VPLHTPLHVRSVYSLGRGTASVEALAGRAARYGHTALALTDRNNLYGAVPFIRACRDHGVRPILGAEIDAPDGLAVLLVRYARGYRNLCRLLSQRMLDRGFSWRESPADPGAWAGLHVLTADPGLLRRLATHVPRDALWGELCAPGDGEAGFAAVAGVAGALGLGTVACAAVAFLDRSDRLLQATLAAVREGGLVGRLEEAPRRHAGSRGDRAFREGGPGVRAGHGDGRPAASSRGAPAHPEAWFRPPAAVASIFRNHPEALRNAGRLAESCDYVPERTRWIFPALDLPAGETPRAYLEALCRGGIRRRYGDAPGGAPAGGRPVPAPPRVERRLERELAVIDRLGFTDYFVIVGEITAFARERGIATVGRGSGAGALTAYLLGITNVDPIRYGLSFERFLHEKRPDCPDLDVDFCWKRRDEVIEFVYARYGRDRVAMISTHNTFGPRSALREAARAHGAAPAAANRLAGAVPRRLDGSLAEALAASPRGAGFPLDRPPWPRVLAEAERLRGMPRHLGLHPGGMVIADRPLDAYVPLERAAKGIVATQYDMRGIEAVGLVKMDLLGNRALTTIQETVELVARRHGRRLDPDRFPDPDPAAAALFRSGDTLGVFQMESPGMRHLNRMLATGDLATVIAAVALIRPGPAASGMKERFVRRLRGLEPVTYPDPRLAPVLEETYGIPLYEEDVMRLAAETAGLTLAEGALFRRTVAAARGAEREELGRVFRRAACRRGFDAAVAASIWDDILRFGSFAFCKAHAAGYGVLAYQAGWLKAHYPLEFTAALMNHHGGMYEKRVHLEDAKRRGIRVLLPDVNRSGEGFTVERDALRVGLARVRGLGAGVRRAVLAERARRPFAGLEDFLARVSLARPEAEALVRAGAFDFTGRTRPSLLCLVAAGSGAFHRRHAARRGRCEDLFPGGEEPWPVPPLPPFTPAQRTWLEWETLGLCVHEHPMVHFRPEAPPPGVLPAREALEREGERVAVAGMTAARRTIATRGGRPMQFLTLEDESGMIECALFGAVAAAHRGRLHGLGPFLVEGRLKTRYDAPTLEVSRVRRLAPPPILAGAVAPIAPDRWGR